MKGILATIIFFICSASAYLIDHCLVTFVSELKFPTLVPYKQLFENHWNTFTFYETVNLNLGFNSEDLLNDDFVIDVKTGFFRFNFRHSKFCAIFFLLTHSLNGTLTAIQTSGYATSDNVLYLIRSGNENVELLEAFENGILENDDESGILTQFVHSNLAFYGLSSTEMIKVFGIYCYTCNNTISDTSVNLKVDTLQTVLSQSQLINSVHHDKGGVLYGSVTGSGYKSAYLELSCGLTLGRLAFHRNLFECESGESIALVLALRSRNATISEFKQFGAAEKPQDGWRLSVRAASLYFRKQPPDILLYRWKIAFSFYRDSFNIFFCKNLNSIVITKWWIYFSVFHWNVYITWLGVLFIYGFFLHRSAKLTIDLVWPFFSYKMILQHSRNFVCGYVLAMLVLNSHYNAAVSTNCFGCQVPSTLQQLLKQNYTFYAYDYQNINVLFSTSTNHQRQAIKTFTQVDNPRKIFFIMMSITHCPTG